MKIPLAIAITFVFVTGPVQWATPVAAGGGSATAAPTPTSKEGRPIDCSKEVWPHFSPSCLRNANDADPVRLVTADRR
jgi:hypothetical protein